MGKLGVIRSSVQSTGLGHRLWLRNRLGTTPTQLPQPWKPSGAAQPPVLAPGRLRDPPSRTASRIGLLLCSPQLPIPSWGA